jgi:hypothetical protein
MLRKPQTNKKINAVAATVVVLSSACLLPPIHAALYVAGSGVMLYTNAIPNLCNYMHNAICDISKPNADSLIHRNVNRLSTSLTACALFYATSALFRQPLNEFLSTIVASSSSKQFIAQEVINIITIVNTFGYTYTATPCVLGATASLLYITGYYNHSLKIIAAGSLCALLYTKLTINNRAGAIENLHFASTCLAAALVQFGADLLNFDKMNPLINLGKEHLVITLGKVTKEILLNI